MARLRLFTAIFVMALLITTSRAAIAQQRVSSYNHWTVYTLKENGTKICYIGASPMQKSGNYKRRSEPHMLVTYVGPGASEVSVSSGYPYNKDKDVVITVDGKTFKFFSEGEHAWARDSETDAKIIALLKKGSQAKAHGESRKGTYSDDVYSLSGFTKAYDHMVRACKP